jgi:hypothetical protein
MGRLAHLKVTLPRLLDTGLSVMLVDYSCPDHAADWAESEHRQATGPGALLHVLRVTGKGRFEKPKAYNLAAEAASKLGAEHLFFLDADTIVKPELGSWVRIHATGKQFCIFEPYAKKRDLYGALLVPTRPFLAVKGYDENFSGWGMEDMDMRLRLALKAKLPFELIPATLADSIPHSAELRTQHYGQKDLRASSARNFELLRANVRRWTGKDITQLTNEDNLSTLIKLWR